MIIYRIQFDELHTKQCRDMIIRIDPTTDHIIQIYTEHSETTCFKFLDGTLRPIFIDLHGKGMRRHYGVTPTEYRETPFYSMYRPVPIEPFYCA